MNESRKLERSERGEELFRIVVGLVIFSVILIVGAIPLYFMALPPGDYYTPEDIANWDFDFDDVGKTKQVRVWGEIKGDWFYQEPIRYWLGETQIILSYGGDVIRCQVKGDVTDQYSEGEWLMVEGVYDPGLWGLGDWIDVDSIEKVPNHTWIAWAVAGIGVLTFFIAMVIGGLKGEELKKK